MKKTVAALTALGVMAGGPVNANPNDKMKDTVAKTNENLAGVVLNEESSKVDSTNVVSFEEEAKKLQKNKEVVKAIMKNKKVQEVVKIFGQERLERLFYEWLSNEEMINNLRGLLTDKNVIKTVEIMADESIQELATQCGGEEFGEVLDNAIESGCDAKLFEDLELQKALKEGNKEKVKQIIESEHISVFEGLMILFMFVCMLIFGAIGENNDLWRNAVKRAQEEEQKKKKNRTKNYYDGKFYYYDNK